MAQKMRKIYDREHMETMGMFYCAEDHPEWSDEQKVTVGKSDKYVQKAIYLQTVQDLKDKLMIY